MRIVLRNHNEQFTIVRAFEARDAVDVREFTSEHLALSFLHRFIGDDSYILKLRSELEGARETTDVMRMSDREILRAIAVLLARGLLKVVTSIVPRATISLGLGAPTGKAEPGKAPPLEHKPAPIVPQEYPILARVESNEIINSTRSLVGALQKLVHLLFNRNLPPSQVAAEYISTAKEVASETRQAIERLDMYIESLLYRDGSLARPPSAIAIEFATLGKTEGKLAGGVVTSMSAGLKSLLWEERERVVPPSTIALEFASLGDMEGSRAKEAVTTFASSLSPLLFKESERSVSMSNLANRDAELPDASSTSAGKPQAEPKKPDAESAAAEWVEISLMDDNDPPAPVPFARYRVRAADGTIYEGTLDDNGKARIEGLKKGAYEVTFPDIDAKDWG